MQKTHVQYRIFVWRIPFCARRACIGSSLTKFSQQYYMYYFPTLYILLYQQFHFIIPNIFKRESWSTRTEVMWVHLCFIPLFLESNSSSYNYIISLYNKYFYYSKLLFPFTMMPQSFIYIYFSQVSSSRYWFIILNPLQTFTSFEEEIIHQILPTLNVGFTFSRHYMFASLFVTWNRRH